MNSGHSKEQTIMLIPSVKIIFGSLSITMEQSIITDARELTRIKHAIVK